MNMSSCLEPVTSGAADHVVRFTRPSPSVFVYCKRSKTGAREGLGTRLFFLTCELIIPTVQKKTAS